MDKKAFLGYISNIQRYVGGETVPANFFAHSSASSKLNAASEPP